MKNVSALFWYIRRLYFISPMLFITLIISSLLIAVLPTLEMILLKELIMEIQHKESFYSTLALMAALALILILTMCIKSISMSKFWALEGLRGDVVTKASLLRLDAFETPQLYDLMQRVSDGIGFRTKSITEALLNSITSVAAIISTSLLLASASPWIPVVILMFSIPYMILKYRHSQETYDVEKEITKNQRFLDYLLKLMSERESIKEIKVLQGGSFIIKKWITTFQENKEKKNQVLIRQSKRAFSYQLLTLISISISFAILIYLTVNDHIGLATLIVMLETVFLCQANWEGSTQHFSQLYGHLFYAADLRAFLSYPEEDKQGISFDDSRIHIRFENVSFKYPQSEQYALRNVSFEILPGEKAALIGVNGAGKSTLVKLLLGIFEPTEGTIYINGIDLKDLDKRTWRNAVGVVFQDFVRYQFHVADNVGFGDIEQYRDSDRAMEKIVQASEKSFLDQIVKNLPYSYQTRLGKYFDGGVELSGGQWQKVAIARAYFRRFRFLIFDEPTSAIDPKSEVRLFQNFMELTREKSALFIVHRLSTTRFANRILVLDDGRLVEQGTFQELLNRNGEFARIYYAQAELYGKEGEVG